MHIKNLSSYFLVIIAGLSWGMVTVGAQILGNLGFSPYEGAYYVQILSVILVMPFLFINYGYRIFLSNIKFFMIYGLIQTFLQIFQYGGVILGAPVALVAFLLYTNPIYTSIFGRLLFKEVINPRKKISIAIAILGIFFLLKPWNVSSEIPVLGAIFGILGGVFLSLYIVYGRKVGLKKLNPPVSSFGKGIFAGIYMTLLIPLISITPLNSILEFSVNPIKYFFPLLIVTAIPVMGIILFYKGAQRVNASTSSILLLLEPVSAAILAAIFFGQKLTVNIMIGGIFILIANYLVITDKGQD